MKIYKLLFLCVFFCGPAICEVPESRRSNAAVERTKLQLEQSFSSQELTLGAPVFFQITKIPAELTVYVRSETGAYRLFRSYPICTYSGGLGPKKKQGDRKSPEGFYAIKPSQMNPWSSYHLSFNLGYPNAYDRSHGYTGDYLMVHGNCVSIGCYAMTDPVIEEIWTIMTEAFGGGQGEIPVHIFPYRMNWPVRSALVDHPDKDFWHSLTPAWVAFSQTKHPPEVSVVRGQYVVKPVIP